MNGQTQARVVVRSRETSIINQGIILNPLVQVLSLIQNLSLGGSVKLEVVLPMGQGQVGIMNEILGYPISQAKKPGRFGLPGLMALQPAEGGAKKSGLMFCCLKCKVQQVIMSLKS